MSEIIERPSADWSRTVKCERCETVSRFDQDDLENDGFKTSGYFFAGTAVTERRYFLTCPVCRHYTIVPNEDVPVIVGLYVRTNGKFWD